MKILFESLEGISTQRIIETTIVVIFLCYIIYKFFPIIKKWFDFFRGKVDRYEDIISQIEKNSKDIEELNKKISGDYDRLNKIQEITIEQQKYIKDGLEERELILRALLGVVQGLQEVGANGPTKKAEAEIQAYLLRKSHSMDSMSEV